jgi:hypothetical protein
VSIKAKIIAHSIAPNGQMIVTWELEYQRFIHGEFMTHRLFSRNAASSRAIPVKNMIAMVRNEPASPIHWGLNQPGMQAHEQLTGVELQTVQDLWTESAQGAAYFATLMDNAGAHKQIANRILEPFQTMKTVMTATCMDNFFWLRNHEDAQPEIKELARLMWEALQDSPRINHLKPGQWHVPYFNEGESSGVWTEGFEATLQDALAISSSCCAQVSYRKLDDTLEKAQMVYQRLVDSEPVHASPFEHQATPIEKSGAKYAEGEDYSNNTKDPESWQQGITHVDRNGNFWSGNFIGWVQHRQLIPNNVCTKYEV